MNNREEILNQIEESFIKIIELTDITKVNLSWKAISKEDPLFSKFYLPVDSVNEIYYSNFSNDTDIYMGLGQYLQEDTLEKISFASFILKRGETFHQVGIVTEDDIRINNLRKSKGESKFSADEIRKRNKRNKVLDRIYEYAKNASLDLDTEVNNLIKKLSESE